MALPYELDGHAYDDAERRGVAQAEIDARIASDETRRLREENARLTQEVAWMRSELAAIRCELRKHDARDIPITSIDMIRKLTRERDEARAEWDRADKLARKRGELLGEVRAEVARLEGLILDWDDHGDEVLFVEVRRIRAQREEGKVSYVGEVEPT